MAYDIAWAISPVNIYQYFPSKLHINIFNNVVFGYCFRIEMIETVKT